MLLQSIRGCIETNNMVSAQMQKTFDELTKEDFYKIAESASKDVLAGKCERGILVNLSSPDYMMYNPVCIPEIKHLVVEFEGGASVKVMIGLD